MRCRGGLDLLVSAGVRGIGVHVFLPPAEDAVDMNGDGHRPLVTVATVPGLRWGCLRTFWGWSLRHFLEVKGGNEGEQEKICLEAQKFSWNGRETRIRIN